jgi:hypothetical protein
MPLAVPVPVRESGELRSTGRATAGASAAAAARAQAPKVTNCHDEPGPALASSTPSRSGCVQACSMPVVAGPRGFGPGAGRGSETQASRCFWCQWLVGARSRGPKVALSFCFIAQICAPPRGPAPPRPRAAPPHPLSRSPPPGGPSVGPLADRRKVGPRWNGPRTHGGPGPGAAGESPRDLMPGFSSVAQQASRHATSCQASAQWQSPKLPARRPTLLVASGK